jgi:hypothetical protein
VEITVGNVVVATGTALLATAGFVWAVATARHGVSDVGFGPWVRKRFANRVWTARINGPLVATLSAVASAAGVWGAVMREGWARAIGAVAAVYFGVFLVASIRLTAWGWRTRLRARR